jgi:hypothetical protein
MIVRGTQRQDTALIVCSNVDKIIDGHPKCRECGERRARTPQLVCSFFAVRRREA